MVRCVIFIGNVSMSFWLPFLWQLLCKSWNGRYIWVCCGNHFLYVVWKHLPGLLGKGLTSSARVRRAFCPSQRNTRPLRVSLNVIPHICVSDFYFLFFSRQLYLFYFSLIYCSWISQTTFFSNFFIKNGFYNIIHTFKNYFVTLFFSFQYQFSVVSKRTLNHLRQFSEFYYNALRGLLMVELHGEIPCAMIYI